MPDPLLTEARFFSFADRRPVVLTLARKPCSAHGAETARVSL